MVAIPSNRVNVSYDFLKFKQNHSISKQVAIPSNRVNVSYSTLPLNIDNKLPGRNPLKSGQCFLLDGGILKIKPAQAGRNPLKSGQCFLHYCMEVIK